MYFSFFDLRIQYCNVLTLGQNNSSVLQDWSVLFSCMEELLGKICFRLLHIMGNNLVSNKANRAMETGVMLMTL